MENQYKYFAFVSYSHQDEKWGKWLHRSLENYKIPKKLVGTKNTLGEDIPKKIFPVFRDRDELPVSSELSENINKALAKSKFLIVICSPNSAKSQWVNEEIIQFKKLHGEDRILPIIVDGEPNVDLKENWSGPEECFPPALKFHLSELGVISDQRTEPICGDARKGKDGKKNALLKLLAGILAVPYNVIKDREQQKRIRNLTFIGVILFFLLIAFGWITWRAVIAEKEALSQRDRANKQTERALTAEELAEAERDSVMIAKQQVEIQKDSTEIAKQEAVIQRDKAIESDKRTKSTLASLYYNKANELVSSNNLLDAIPYVLESCALDNDNIGYKMKLDNLTQFDRFYSLHNYIEREYFIQSDNIKIALSSIDKDCDFISSDLKYYVKIDKDSCSIIDIESGEITYQFAKNGERIRQVSFDHSSQISIVLIGNVINLVDLSQKRLIHNPESDSLRIISKSEIDPLGKTYYTFYSTNGDSHELIIKETKSNNVILKYDLQGGLFKFSYSPKGNYLAIKSDESIWIIELYGDNSLMQLENTDSFSKYTFTSDEKYIYLVTKNSVVKFFELSNGVEVATLKHQEGNIRELLYDPVKKNLFTLFRANSNIDAIIKWDVFKNEIVREIKLTEKIFVSCFTQSDDGMHILYGSNNGLVRVADKENINTLFEYNHQNKYVHNVSLSPDMRYILSSANDNACIVWKVGTKKPLFKLNHPYEVQASYWGKDGKTIITIDSQGSVYLWGCDNLKPFVNAISTKPGILSDVHFLKDKPLMFKISWDMYTSSVSFLPFENGLSVELFDMEKNCKIGDGFDIISNGAEYAIDPLGEKLLTITKNLINIYDIKTRTILKTINAGEPVLDAVFNPNGEEFAVKLKRKIITYNSENFKEIIQIETKWCTSERYLFVDYILDGTKIISGYNNEIEIFSNNTTPYYFLYTSSGNIESIVCSDDGKYLIPFSRISNFSIIDVNKREILLNKMLDSRVKGVCFNPEKNEFVIATENYTNIWDVSSKEILREIDNRGEIEFIEYSGDGRFILASTVNNKLFVWNSLHGNVVAEYNDFNEKIEYAKFAFDNESVIIGFSHYFKKYKFVQNINYYNRLFQWWKSTLLKNVDNRGTLYNLPILNQKQNASKGINSTKDVKLFKHPLDDNFYEDTKRKILDNYEATLLYDFEGLYDHFSTDTTFLAAYIAKLVNEKDITNYELIIAKNIRSQLIGNVSKNYEVWFFLAKYYINLSAFEKALSCINKACCINPKSMILYLLRAQVYKHLHRTYDYKESIRIAFAIFKDNENRSTDFVSIKSILLLRDELKNAQLIKELEYVCFYIVNYYKTQNQRANNSKYNNELSNSFEYLSFVQFLSSDFDHSIISAMQGLKLQPSQISQYRIIAHSNLFSGNYEIAKKVYLNYSEEILSKNDDFGYFKDYCLKDFAYFEKNGITHPDIQKIKELLSN